jgi:hypothetical protein
MALDFPNSPVDKQVFSASNGIVYQYNATYTAWLPVSALIAPPADFYAIGTSSGIPTSPVTLTGWTVSDGNAGGWFNPATGRFVPPPGRYCVFGGIYFSSTTTAVTCYVNICKNGVNLIAGGTYAGMSSAQANYYGGSHQQVIVDCNGSDYIDMRSMAGATTNVALPMWFGAFALPGGAQPSPAFTPTWRQLYRISPSAGQGPIDLVSIPSDINDIELRFDVTPTTGAQDFILQVITASGVIAASYAWSTKWGNHAQASGAAPAVYNSTASGMTSGFALNGSVVGNRVSYTINGSLKINNIRDNSRTKYANWHCGFLEQTGTYVVDMEGGGYQSGGLAITGLRCTWTSTTFAAGGELSLLGSP